MPDAPAFTPIRFRVYDPATGEMHYPGGTDVAFAVPGDGRGVIRTGGKLGIELWPGAVPLLSTGLRDADGVEVFDGDLWLPARATTPETVERSHTGWDPFDRVDADGNGEYEPTDGRVVGHVYAPAEAG